MKLPQKIVVIQTAFIGDAILATSIIEKLHHTYPKAEIDYLVRKGAEGLFINHPFIHRLYIFDKKNKWSSLWALIKALRQHEYDYAINCQRYFTSGLLTVCSGAKRKIGYKKNPLSLLFSESYIHSFNQTHEVDRLHTLVKNITDNTPGKPKIYPPLFPPSNKPYITIAPGSVWATKQLPIQKWVQLIDRLPANVQVYLMGGTSEKKVCEELISLCHRKNDIYIKAGELNLLESAAWMKNAVINYVNDSAPMHLCSATDAPVCAVYCSTVPAFGYGPLSSFSRVIEPTEPLECRPCGLHGHSECPKHHFLCGHSVSTDDLLHAYYSACNIMDSKVMPGPNAAPKM